MWENTLKNLIYQKGKAGMLKDVAKCKEKQAVGNGLTPKGSNMFTPHRTFQNNFLTLK